MRLFISFFIVQIVFVIKTISYGELGFNLGSYLPNRYCKHVEDFKNDLRAINSVSRLVKTYSLDVCTFPAILIAAEELDFKVVVGIWVKPKQKNMDEEIKLLKKHLKDFLVNTIHSFVVGSEVLYRQDLHAKKLADHLKQVKDSLRDIYDKNQVSYENTPVGFADTWNAIIEQDTTKLIEVSDLVYVNIFPYWQNKLVLDAPSSLLNNLSEAYKRISDVKQNKLIPIWIGETGWPTNGENKGLSVPSVKNSKEFWNNLVCGLLYWNINVMMFEAFDEPLKHKDALNVENFWGTWDVNRVPKFDMRCNFP